MQTIWEQKRDELAKEEKLMQLRRLHVVQYEDRNTLDYIDMQAFELIQKFPEVFNVNNLDSKLSNK